MPSKTSQLRNSLEHFDERLDREITRIDRDGPPSELAVFNLAMTTDDLLGRSVYPIRRYDIRKRELQLPSLPTSGETV